MRLANDRRLGFSLFGWFGALYRVESVEFSPLQFYPCKSEGKTIIRPKMRNVWHLFFGLFYVLCVEILDFTLIQFIISFCFNQFQSSNSWNGKHVICLLFTNFFLWKNNISLLFVCYLMFYICFFIQYLKLFITPSQFINEKIMCFDVFKFTLSYINNNTHDNRVNI